MPIKILIICSGNIPNFKLEINQAFVFEQAEAIKKKYSVEFEYFLIQGKGFIGYLHHVIKLNQLLRKNYYDLIHAHYGISGFLAILQRYVPVVVTLHGSDVNEPLPRFFSKLARKFSKATIFVSNKMAQYFRSTERDFVVPCGIDLERFFLMDKRESLSLLNLDPKQLYVLFGASFDNPVKNAQLAINSVKLLDQKITLIELRDKNRDEVRLLLNAVDLLLLTSFSEGSPQIIKEAMACNCPIISTDVGDVSEILAETEGCYMASFDTSDLAQKILKVINNKKKTDGRSKILHYDNNLIATEIYKIYNIVIQDNVNYKHKISSN